MKEGAFVYSFRIGGMERKQAAAVIAEATGEEVKYAGPRSFAYTIGGWNIDRNSTVLTPVCEVGEIKNLSAVLEALLSAGAVAEGEGTLTFSAEGHSCVTLRNIVNQIWSKQDLLQKALDREKDIVPASLVKAINASPVSSVEDFFRVIEKAIEAGEPINSGDVVFEAANKTVGFKFFNATLNPEKLSAYVKLCSRICEQAKQQKFTSVKQRETLNEKYSMRTWLLRLGFIGGEFKSERKVLLEKLSGNGSFRVGKPDNSLENQEN